ncbi:MAG TPA: UrcA family protein [Alphaproteobacteria bacterium]|nr:UrcA family protein [Alphaproteobacteria bacterium]
MLRETCRQRQHRAFTRPAARRKWTMFPFSTGALAMTSPLKTTLAIALLTAGLTSGLAFSPAARADGLNQDAPSRVVKYDDLAVSTRAGAQTLYNRIRSAAKAVCGDIHSSRDLQTSLNRLKCVSELVDKAVKDVDEPVLTELYEHSNVRYAGR